MIRISNRLALASALVALGLLWNGDMVSSSRGSLVSTADAVVGRPATPVSYAGVARRSTVGVNAGGPVNRVGVR